MKDENGIEICCDNCKHCEYCDGKFYPDSGDSCGFLPSVAAYEARIAELQRELNIVQASERAEAQEADRLRAEVKELGKKLTETVKLLGERSRECGELEAYNEVLQRRVEEFSMELLNRTMKENKDVLERLKQAESEEKCLPESSINKPIRRASPKWQNVKAGDKLTLYTGLRTKQCRKLGEAVVKSITPIVLLPAEEDCETRTALWSIRPCAYDLKSMIFADGFESVDDFWKFFVEHYGSQPIEMNVIRWTDFKEAKDARGTLGGNGDER